MAQSLSSTFGAMFLNQVSSITDLISPHRMTFCRAPDGDIIMSYHIATTRARISFLGIISITSIYYSTKLLNGNFNHTTYILMTFKTIL